MARPALTDDQVEAFRKRASDVAMRLFRDEGYERFSLRTLARELDCSHATPYRYFEDKAEIFAVVRAEGFRRFADFLTRRLQGEADAHARLVILGRAYYDFAQVESAAFVVIFEMGQPERGTYPFVEQASRDAWMVLLSVVREAVEAGVIEGDVARLAHVMWASIHGVASLALAQKLSMGMTGEELVDATTAALIAAHRPARATSSSSTSSSRSPRASSALRDGSSRDSASSSSKVHP